MIKQWMLFLLAGMIFTPTGWPQTDTHSLEKALKGKQFELRNYSADPVASYAWIDSKLVSWPVKLHTLGAFTVKSVKIKNDRLILEGKRATFVGHTKTDHEKLSVNVPMKLEVDLRGANMVSVLPQLSEALFFPDLKAAIAGLPEPLGGQLPFVTNGTPAAHCNCKHFYNGSHWVILPRSSKDYSDPILLYSAEPKFSDEARRDKINGSVSLLFFISETGHIGEIWLTHPLGYGLDENAAKAVGQYAFKPALYKGAPVETALNVEVDFEVF